MLTRRWTTKPPLGAQISRGHPLAQGLTAAFLLNEQAGPPIDLIAGLALTLKSGTTRDVGKQGWGLRADANDEGAYATAPTHLKPAQKASVFWYGQFTGVPDANTDMAGVYYDSAGGSPFTCYMVGYSSGAVIVARSNSGSIVTASSSIGAAAGDVRACLATADLTKDVLTLYVDGVSRGTNSFGGAGGSISYSATSNFSIGQEQAALGRNPRHITYCAYTWNRVLTPSEAWALYQNPWALVAPRPAVYFSLPAGGAGPTLVTIACTGVGVAVLSTRATYLRTLAATATGVAALQKKTSKAPMELVATGVVGLQKKTSKFFDVAAVGVASLAESTLHFVTSAAAAVGVAGLTTGRVFAQAVAAVGVGVADLAAVALGAATFLSSYVVAFRRRRR